MEKNRLEAFSDGVLAIIITIMVLDLKGRRQAARTDADLKPLLPVFLSYVLSFIYVGIYWNNHHHMFHSTKHVTGGILWANLHLLFWLSLFPFTTALGGREPSRADARRRLWLRAADGGHRLLHFATRHHRPAGPRLPARGGHREGLERQSSRPCSISLAIPLAFVSPWIADGLYVFVALLWLVPDRRIERVLAKPEK